MAREEYQAELTITSRHTYTVVARSPEEAISNAEDLFHSGDLGYDVTSDIEYADAYTLREELIESEDHDDPSGSD